MAVLIESGVVGFDEVFESFPTAKGVRKGITLCLEPGHAHFGCGAGCGCGWSSSRSDRSYGPQ